jgi:transcription antitermination factor NusG
MLLHNSVGAEDHWFAVQVRSGREPLCARHLEMRGYSVFLPCYHEDRRWSDRVKRVERALFAGYVFCRADAEIVAKVVTAPGVIRVVGDGRQPLPVAAAEIAALRQVIDAGLRTEPSEYLRAGQRVLIQGGPLRGTEGTVVRMHNGHRLIISVSVLQRSVAVEIDPAWVWIPPETRLRIAVERGAAPALPS